MRFDKVRASRPSKFMFLCGGFIAKENSARAANLRDYLFRVRGIGSRFEIVLAEAANQLFRDSEYGDLISFEEDIARIASVVLVIAESPGSLAELGAFTSNETIRNALGVVIQQQHAVAESFVRYGPVERLKRLRRDSLAVYPWRTHANGSLNISSTKPHYNQIVKFLDDQIRSVPTSTTFDRLGEAALFYKIYWIIHLSLAVSLTTLYDYVRLIAPNTSDETVRNKLFCMQLAGWIERYRYSNKDFVWARHDSEPLDYEFHSHVTERSSLRRNLKVKTALRRAESLPPYVRSAAAAARLAGTL